MRSIHEQININFNFAEYEHLLAYDATTGKTISRL